VSDVDTEIRKGMEAERLLDEPLMKQAFLGIESGLVENLKRVPMGDTKTQHELVLTLQLLEKLKGHFLTVMQTGKMARIQKESMAKRVVRAVRG
jgi:hypothetical protein